MELVDVTALVRNNENEPVRPSLSILIHDLVFGEAADFFVSL